MEIKVVDPISLVVFENVFEESQRKEMFLELSDHVKEKSLLSPDKTGSAKNEDGSLKKKNSALFLDGLYESQQERDKSAILRNTEDVLLSYEMKLKLKEINPFYGILNKVNKHFTLINYYEDSDFYDFHEDESAFSILTFLFKDPRSFSGGNVIFRVSGKEFEVKVKDNMSVIFPSCYEHKVIPIKMNQISDKEPLGRFSIAQFLHVNG